MTESPSAWIAAALEVTRLVETLDGIVVFRPGDAEEVRPDRGGCLGWHALDLLGMTSAGEAQLQIEGLLAEARAGREGTHRLTTGGGDVTLLAHPLPGGRAELWLALPRSEVSLEVQKRAAISDMAAAISHEVSNALSAIGGWADLLLESANRGAVDPQGLDRIARCTRVAQGISRRLLDVARDESAGDAPREEIDVAELAREVGDLLHPAARTARVGLEVDALGPAEVRGHRADLFSALWNLVKNAIEACDEEGQVVLRVQPFGQRVQVEVIDDGPGMDARTVASAFTPYFTTKRSGTGLGLALVERAATAIGGAVEIDSAPGRGTRFTITLPRTGRHSDTYPPVTLRAPRGTTDGTPLAGVRVLVVDDDDALGDMVGTSLELRGASVTTRRSAQSSRDLEGHFDIALIDMVLVDGRGDELLASLRQRGLVGAAMLVSGMAERPRLVPGGEPDEWVRKPFEMAPLVERILHTLERHRMLATATAARPS